MRRILRLKKRLKILNEHLLTNLELVNQLDMAYMKYKKLKKTTYKELNFQEALAQSKAAKEVQQSPAAIQIIQLI